MADLVKLTEAIVAGFNRRHPESKDRHWPEDFSHENGQYENICCHCRHHFLGHKRRVVCKLCVTPAEKT
jgi:hypothetical protein